MPNVCPRCGESTSALLTQAAEIGWDKAVASLRYEDGTPVEIVSMENPYRTDPPDGRTDDV